MNYISVEHVIVKSCWLAGWRCGVLSVDAENLIVKFHRKDSTTRRLLLLQDLSIFFIALHYVHCLSISLDLEAPYCWGTKHDCSTSPEAAAATATIPTAKDPCCGFNDCSTSPKAAAATGRHQAASGSL